MYKINKSRVVHSALICFWLRKDIIIMKIHHNRIFYVCFCFIILLTNSCKAQQTNVVKSFFKEQASIVYNKCLDDDDYKYYKKNNLKEAINSTESNCREITERYDHFSENTLKFLDSLGFKNNKQDFIILNKPLNSIYYASPIVTVFKAKNVNRYSVIHNYTSYDDSKKEFVTLTDHALGGFHADKILNLFEDYLYYKKGSLISENIKDFSQSARPNLCYVVARIKGRFFIKEYYYLDKD